MPAANWGFGGGGLNIFFRGRNKFCRSGDRRAFGLPGQGGDHFY